MVLLPAQSESTCVVIGMVFMQTKLLDSLGGFDEAPRDPPDRGPVAHLGLSQARCLRRELQVRPVQTRTVHTSNQSLEP